MGSTVYTWSSVCIALIMFCVSGLRTTRAEGTTCTCSSYNGGCDFTNVCRPSPAECLERNVAVGKEATVSSLYKGGTEKSGAGCLAVNGNRTNVFISVSQPSPNCVHTAVGEGDLYWEVDLGREFLISYISVYGRDEVTYNTLRKSTITIDSKTCYHFPENENPPVNITTTCERQQGRMIKLEKDPNTDSRKYFCLCELEVWVNCSLNGFYGKNCSECGHCLEGSVCDYSTGECPDGCDSGWQGERCDQDCSFMYGPNCLYPCGQCKDKASCDRFNGTCLFGCEPGYQSEYCNKSCTEGRYGEDCNETCGHCLNNVNCDSVNGTCHTGCDTGWQGDNCDKQCSNNTYSERCSKTCGWCSNDTQCDVVNGYCSSCQLGFQTPMCTECENGKYGPVCNQNCTNCDGDGECDKDTGRCLEGCVAGWTRDNCSTPCPPGTYGKQCDELCGSCLGNTTCRHTDGICEKGCEDNSTDDICKSAEPKGDEDKTPLVVSVTSALVIVFIVVVITVVIVIIRRRRQREHTNKRNNTASNRQHHQNCSDANLSFETACPLPEVTVNTRRGPKNAKPVMAVKPTQGSRFTVQDSSDNIYVNTQMTDSALVDRGASTNLLDLPQDLEEETGNTYRNDESVYSTFRASRPELDDVQRHLVDLLASGQLQSQFESLPKGLDDDHEAAKLPVNIKKNRYYSVLPYDKSRVVLTDGYDGENATDYINANYISGLSHNKTYIAAQGPRDNTVDDFWRMIWQENVEQVLMLTGLIEAGKSKCFEYWPSLEKSETYGPVTVTGLDVQRRATFLIRKFAIKRTGSSEEREVEQYHYVAWPDHGVPSPTSLLNFWRFAKARRTTQTTSPILVHCTAGVGRTGTYIGLDIAFEHAVAQKKVDVLGIVKRMRQERCIMVQTVEQYIFLHEIVMEAYTARDTLIPVDDFYKIFDKPINAFKENKRIDQEFKAVMHMRSVAKPLATQVALQEVNKAKIRNMEVLPADNHLVYLTAYVTKRNQFINAVYLSTYKEYQGLILTQLPLQETLVDFWRLVDGSDVKTIVSLGSENDKSIVKDICQYWPMDAGTSLTTGPYTLTHKLTLSLGNNLTSYVIILEKKGEPSPREVQLLHYKDWEGDLPGNIAEFLHFLETLETIRSKDQKPSPLVVQCLDGVAKCGLFCAVSSIVSRLTFDREVDVYMDVREVNCVRPQAVKSLAQYRYCYQVAQQRVAELSLYSNV